MKARTIVDIMQNWIGATKGSEKHKEIVNLYNSLNPLPRGYKLTISDAWCAATVTAAFIKAGYTKLLPGECSCGRMIEQLKTLGEWCEDDAYEPKAGDLIFFAWTDPNPEADNTEGHDHVGIVEFCSSGFIHTIEGNYSNSVKRRTLKVNGKNIRGFGVIKYDETDAIYYTAQRGDTLAKVAKRYCTTKEAIIKLNPESIKAPLYWLYAGTRYRIM